MTLLVLEDMDPWGQLLGDGTTVHVEQITLVPSATALKKKESNSSTRDVNRGPVFNNLFLPDLRAMIFSSWSRHMSVFARRTLGQFRSLSRITSPVNHGADDKEVMGSTATASPSRIIVSVAATDQSCTVLVFPYLSIQHRRARPQVR